LLALVWAAFNDISFPGKEHTAMAKLYSHTQVGYVMLTLLTLGTFCTTFWMIYLGFSWIAFFSLVVLDVSLILFSTLTVEISDGILDVKIGPGILHKRFNLTDVRDCFIPSSLLHPTIGERLMPEGWLYNLSGRHAVELKMKNGRYYRIGTDVPSELAEHIRASLAMRHA
jgi:hypothetical protein